eukprot:GHVS01022837.1.p4 GENE.GHVS01022837.1~~GHVS01022837.1.p4  ORF type:complete len:109 (-),score=8.82 GHVS01022837.1:277-603(-)
MNKYNTNDCLYAATITMTIFHYRFPPSHRTSIPALSAPPAAVNANYSTAADERLSFKSMRHSIMMLEIRNAPTERSIHIHECANRQIHKDVHIHDHPHNTHTRTTMQR